VLWVGKAGTFALMFAYPAFLLGDGTASWQEPVRVVAWITGLIGLTLAGWRPPRTCRSPGGPWRTAPARSEGKAS